MTQATGLQPKQLAAPTATVTKATLEAKELKSAHLSPYHPSQWSISKATGLAPKLPGYNQCQWATSQATGPQTQSLGYQPTYWSTTKATDYKQKPISYIKSMSANQATCLPPYHWAVTQATGLPPRPFCTQPGHLNWVGITWANSIPQLLGHQQASGLPTKPLG